MSRGCLFIWILSILFISSNVNVNVNARYHYHKNPKAKGSGKGSPPPSPVSAPSTPAHHPSNPPSVPSDPYPGAGGDASDCIFDVTAYGAAGDGSSDDTAAFREAWKAACAVESATILAPKDKVFIITSIIFSGPCKPGLVFQVRISSTIF